MRKCFQTFLWKYLNENIVQSPRCARAVTLYSLSGPGLHNKTTYVCKG